MKQKLNAKDFILIGILTALMWIICMIISTIMSVAGPVTNVFYPSVVGYSEWHRYDASAGQSSEERRVYHLCRNSGYSVPAGRCFLVHSHRLGNWRCHLRFSDHGPK